MKQFVAACSIFLGSASFAWSAAHARAHYVLSPSNTSFTASGIMLYTTPEGDLQCTWTLTGLTNAKGGGKITHFSATGSPTCDSIKGMHKWPVKTVNSANLVIEKMMITIPGIITCGPGDFYMNDNGSGTWLSGPTNFNCSFGGSMATTPPITIQYVP